MIGRLHGVFLVFLVLALAWNLLAARHKGRWRTPECLLVLPLQVAATAVLLHDRLVPDAEPWLLRGVVPFLFPLLFALALVQNALVLRQRGVRLTDVPIVLFDVGVGAALLAGAAVARGATLSAGATALLHDHLVLQALLGSHVAPLWSASWHVPLLLRRDPPPTLLAVLAGTLPAAVAAFGVVLMAAVHQSSQRVVASFAHQPQVASLRDGLSTAVWLRPSPGDPLPAPGDHEAWVLPADHDGEHLPAPRRPLLLALAAPASWQLATPPSEQCLATFVEGAGRLAARLQPALLLPFPDPDGEAPLFLDEAVPFERWAEWFGRARERVRAASPSTRLGLRLSGTGLGSERLFSVLADLVDVAGPRLHPGGAERGGAEQAGQVLATWRSWRSERDRSPAFWILAAGASPLGYGEDGQAAFVQGCLARADADPDVAGIVLVGWRDRGHTLGLLRADGGARAAAATVARLLPSSPGAAGR